jgi:hypothetical protein
LVALICRHKPPVVVPPPVIPPVPTKPVLVNLVNAPDKWFKQLENGDTKIENVVISAGGGLHCRTNGRAICKNFFSRSVPSGEGMYFIIVATDPCKEFVLDNTDYEKDPVDGWISHGNEAAIRLMGNFESATLLGVKIVGRMHDDSDKGAGAFNPKDWQKTKLLAPPSYTANGIVHPKAIGQKLPSGGHARWWKQGLQVRAGKKFVMQGGSIIGLWDIGAQAAPLDPQRIESAVYEGVGLTDEPHLTDPKSYGTVERRDCYVIDVTGKPQLKGGQLVKWPNNVWSGK